MSVRSEEAQRNSEKIQKLLWKVEIRWNKFMEKFEGEPSMKETTDEEAFQSYVEDFRLTPEDFDKKILDVGAGAAQFAKWAKEHGASREIYSLEPKKEYLAEKDKSVVARAETMPFMKDSFDLVLSDSAIPNVYKGEGNADVVEKKVINSLQEMVRVVRPGGEIRLARVLMGKEDKSQQILSQSIEEALGNLEAEGDVKIEKIRIPSDDTYKHDENNNPVKLSAEAFLIIIRKQKKLTN